LTPYTRQMCISSILFDISASGSEAGAPAGGWGGRVHAGTQTGVQRSHEDTSILHPSSCTQERSAWRMSSFLASIKLPWFFFFLQNSVVLWFMIYLCTSFLNRDLYFLIKNIPLPLKTMSVLFMMNVSVEGRCYINILHNWLQTGFQIWSLTKSSSTSPDLMGGAYNHNSVMVGLGCGSTL